MPSELNIEHAILEWCDRQGYVCKKLHLLREKGFPDRTVFCGSGKTVYLEVKAKSGIISPQQRVWIDYLQENGYLAAVVRSLDEAKAIIEGQ